MTPERPIHLLQIVPEKLPTFRADVSALFGRYLPRFGIHCAIVGKSAESTSISSPFKDEIRVSWAGHRFLAELRFVYVALRKAVTIPRNACDIIQARDMVSIGLLLLLVARLRGIPFVYWMSFLMTEGRVENARAARLAGRWIKASMMMAKARLEGFVLYRFLLPAADHVFVQSDAMAAFVQARLTRPRELTPVPMGVDLEAMDPDLPPRTWPGWEGKQVIAYLGTLDRMRQLNVLVAALAIVIRRHPDTRLLLVGAGKDADIQAINAAAIEFGVRDAVAISGWRPTQEAWALVKATVLAVSPIPRNQILDAGSPTKLIEYLAMRVPAIGNDNPDQKLVLTASDAGWLCGSQPEDYAHAICAILDEPTAAQNRASRGPEYIAEHRSYAAIASKVAGAYHRLLRVPYA